MSSASAHTAIAKACVVLHESAGRLATAFKQETGRHVYTTPTSYLDLISLYKELLASRRSKVQTQLTRCDPRTRFSLPFLCIAPN